MSARVTFILMRVDQVIRRWCPEYQTTLPRRGEKRASRLKPGIPIGRSIFSDHVGFFHIHWQKKNSPRHRLRHSTSPAKWPRALFVLRAIRLVNKELRGRLYFLILLQIFCNCISPEPTLLYLIVQAYVCFRCVFFRLLPNQIALVGSLNLIELNCLSESRLWEVHKLNHHHVSGPLMLICQSHVIYFPENSCFNKDRLVKVYFSQHFRFTRSGEDCPDCSERLSVHIKHSWRYQGFLFIASGRTICCQ